MQKITAKYIRTFDPCETGIINFEQNYPDFNGSLIELLKLDKVPYYDKLWLVTKIVDVKILQQWSVECAETVLPNYEKAFPNDTRVRDCLETVKKVLAGELHIEAARLAAESARLVAESVESAWSAAESVALSARLVARSARSAKKEQEDLNLSLLIALIENKE